MLTSNKYPIEVCCVVADHSDIDTDIEIVNEHSSNLGLNFKVREYDSWKYADDRYSITSLPAFHVYFGEGYVDTFYPDEKVLNNIEECIKKYEEIQKERKKFIEAWMNFLKFWKAKRA
jgi:hypothetical protein